MSNLYGHRSDPPATAIPMRYRWVSGTNNKGLPPDLPPEPADGSPLPRVGEHVVLMDDGRDMRPDTPIAEVVAVIHDHFNGHALVIIAPTAPWKWPW